MNTPYWQDPGIQLRRFYDVTVGADWHDMSHVTWQIHRIILGRNAYAGTVRKTKINLSLWESTPTSKFDVAPPEVATPKVATFTQYRGWQIRVSYLVSGWDTLESHIKFWVGTHYKIWLHFDNIQDDQSMGFIRVLSCVPYYIGFTFLSGFSKNLFSGFDMIHFQFAFVFPDIFFYFSLNIFCLNFQT